MSESDKPILSNFMAFSKKEAAIPVAKEASYSALNSTVYVSFVVMVIVAFLILVVFYQRGGGEDMVNNWMASIQLDKWWLSTHLNSAGELASTYVPKNFLQPSSEDIAASLQLG